MKNKNIAVAVLMAVSLSLASACSTKTEEPKKVVYIKQADVVTEKIGVSGMTCVGCEVTLEDNISKIEGVVSVKASHTDEQAVIEFDSTKTDLYTIAQTIKESGYNVNEK